MENPQNWFDCLVCDEKTRFYHLDAQICRSCSGFVRRIANENIDYRCRRDGKCEISASRTACRGCRLQRALKAGVCLEALKKTNGSIKPKGKPKILKNLINGYDIFMLAQRLLHLEMSPELGLDNKKLVLAQKKQIVKIEQQTLPLIITFFNENFGPFKDLPQKIKLKLISDTLVDFGIFHRAFLTGCFFPAIDDSRLCFTNAYYMLLDPNLIEWFFEGYIPVEQIEDHLTLAAPLVHKYRKNITKFKKLEARKIDVMVLIFLALWKRMELANLLNIDLVEYKEHMMVEWTADLRKQYGPVDGNLRLAKFMQYFLETDDLSIDFKNVVTLLNLNSLSIGKDQMCEVIEHMKTLDL